MMARSHDGNRNGPASRRLRFDDLTSFVTQSSETSAIEASEGYSGRRLVIVAGATILVLWVSLYLLFRDWRSRYRSRADFGATQIAPIIDELASIEPPGVDDEAWDNAVKDTHSMLVSVTGANLLEIQQMQLLRAELQQTVARARSHPETAPDELAGIWNAMSDRAEFVLQEGVSGRRKAHTRPAILPPRPAKKRGSQ
jgi:hypothetical protein